MKILKYVAVVITAMLIMINLNQPVAEAMTFDEMRSKIQRWTQIGQSQGGSKISGNEIGNILKPIVNILTAIGVIALIVITMIMGIKYMFATPEEAAKLKQQLIGLVGSAVVVLGATAIWKIIYNILVASKL